MKGTKLNGSFASLSPQSHRGVGGLRMHYWFPVTRVRLPGEVLNCDGKRAHCSTSHWTWLTWQQTPLRIISKATEPWKNINDWAFFLFFETKKNLCTRRVVIFKTHLYPEDGLSSDTPTPRLSLSIMVTFETIEHIISRFSTHSLSRLLTHLITRSPLAYSLTHELSVSHAKVHHLPCSNSWFGADDPTQPPSLHPLKSSFHWLNDLLHPLIHFHQQLLLQQSWANSLKSLPRRARSRWKSLQCCLGTLPLCSDTEITG